MLISILTPFYASDPRRPEVAAQITAYLDALAVQEGPVEIILGGTGPERRSPLEPLLAARRDAGYPHTLRALHARFDPDRSPPQSRAAAINDAAAVARGEVLLILHIDSRLSRGALAEVRGLAHQGWRAGAYPKRYQPRPRLLWAQEWWLNKWRLRCRKHTVATNAVWLARELWRDLPAWRLLEDVALSDRLRRELGLEGIHVSRLPVEASTEKYLRTGLLESIAINFCVMALFRIGRVAPDALADELYSRGRLRVGGASFWPSLARQVWRASRWRIVGPSR